MQSKDRTYQFISDPTHKENLSGRVTAACLNCRKKKIKCSGEASCKQCLEKGTVCEVRLLGVLLSCVQLIKSTLGSTVTQKTSQGPHVSPKYIKVSGRH